MKSVTLILPEPIDLRAVCEAYRNIGRVDLQSPLRLVVEGAWGWFGIDIDQRIKEDFDPEELGEFAHLVQTPFFAQLEYRNEQSAKHAIDLLPVKGNAYLDNDHGLVAEIGEIKRRLRAGVEWQATSS